MVPRAGYDKCAVTNATPANLNTVLPMSLVAAFCQCWRIARLKAFDSVLHEIVVIGQAARRLSDDVRAAHPEVPWREIIGMRSIMTHGYDQIVTTSFGW
jgi:hypothetical protein